MICDWCHKPSPKVDEENQFQEVRVYVRNVLLHLPPGMPPSIDHGAEMWHAELCPTCLGCMIEVLDSQLNHQVVDEKRQHVERRKQPHKFMVKKEPGESV